MKHKLSAQVLSFLVRAGKYLMYWLKKKITMPGRYVTKLLVVKIFDNFWGYFEKYHFKVKNALATFCATFKTWVIFYSNIWSYCLSSIFL